MGYLEREGGRRIYYEDHAGSGLPVLLIHGWAMSGRVWDATMVALRAKGHRVVTFDQRGCGLSDKDFHDSRIAASGADTVALCDALGLTRVVLNGWSLGGAVAVDAAIRLKERCAGVVLTCGASPRYTRTDDFPHGGAVSDVAGTVAALARDRATVLRGVAQIVCAKPVGAAVEDWMWSIFMQSTPCADASLTDLAHLDQRAELAALKAPVLVITGSADAFTPPGIGEAAAALAPRSSLVCFEGSGHAPFLEDFDAYTTALNAFLSPLA